MELWQKLQKTKDPKFSKTLGAEALTAPLLMRSLNLDKQIRHISKLSERYKYLCNREHDITFSQIKHQFFGYLIETQWSSNWALYIGSLNDLILELLSIPSYTIKMKLVFVYVGNGRKSYWSNFDDPLFHS